MPTITESADAPSNSSTSYSFAPGDVFLGSIIPAGDSDWIETSLGVGFGYYAVMQSDGSPTGLTSNRLFLVDDIGAEQDRSNSFDRTQAVVSLSPTETGTYYLVANPRSDSATGNYQLNLVQEVANGRITNATLGVGDSLNSAIDYGTDYDYFRITLDPGYGYYAVMESDGSPTGLTSNRLYLYNDIGEEVDESSSSDSTQAVVSLSPTETGTYYLVADPRSDSATGNYDLSLLQEVANGTSTNATLGVGDSLNSAIDYGTDYDYFRITLDPGYGYYAVMESDGSPTGLTSNRLYLYNDIGEEVDESSSSDSAQAVVSLSPTETGTYYLSANPRSSVATGNYDLSLLQEVANGTTTNAMLTEGVLTEGTIEYSGDQDMYGFDVEGGYSYLFVMQGATGGDPLGANRIEVYDANGGYLYDSSTGNPAYTTYHAEQSGSIYVAADPSNSDIGNYELLAHREIANGIYTETDLAVGQTLNSQLEYDRDVDYLRVALKAGVTYTFDLEGGGGSGAIPVAALALRNANGQLVPEMEVFTRSGAAQLVYTPTTGGTYFVRVGIDSFSARGGTYDLTLTGSDLANTPGPDFLGGGAGPDSITGAGGNDTLSGLAGNDTLRGEGGNDLAYAGPGQDSLDGGPGNDTLYGAGDNDTLSGGDGNDLLGGGAGDDDMDGGLGADALWTAGGNDSAEGGGGNDTLGGATGDDMLSGGDGADELWGASGNDTAFGGAGDDTLGGADGNDSLVGNAGADELWGASGNDTLEGGAGADQLGGGLGNDSLTGGSENDSLYGGLGNDTLLGQFGDDLIFGAAGDDFIAGGSGADTLYAGPGADTIGYGVGDGADEVHGFATAQDRLQLDDALWFGTLGTLTAAEVATRFGAAQGADYVLDFGSGNVVTLVGQAAAAANIPTAFDIV